MTYLILIRHGETQWTKLQKFQGSTDTRLTSKGRRQAYAIAKALKSSGIQHLYCSTLSRAKDTAEIIRRSIRKKVRTDGRLNELNFGHWEGKSRQQLLKERDPIYARWTRGQLLTPTRGESLQSMRKRSGNFIARCLKSHKGKRIAVVAHGGTIKMIIDEALNLPVRSLWSLRIDPASISVLGFHPQFRQLVSLNVTSHLHRAKGMALGHF